MCFANWQDFDLHRCEPKRESTNVFFYQESDNAFYGSDRRTMDDKSSMRFAIFTYIGKIKTVGHTEVVLGGKSGVFFAVGVFHLNVYFWSVKSGFVFNFFKFRPALYH